MDSNTTDEHDFNGALLLTEPHFADEATLLAARPVVPLDEIKATQLSARRLVFLTIGCALLVGALVAAVIYKQRGREQPSEIVSAAVPGAAAMNFDEPAPVALAGDAEGIATGTNPEAVATVTKKPEAQPSRTVAATRVIVKRKEPVAVQFDERDGRVDERDGRAREREREIDARRDWRRSERETRRGRGGRDRRSGDDLLRIRDIFEGRRRP